MINLNKDKDDKIPYYVPDTKQIIAYSIAIGIILTGAILASIMSYKNDAETNNSAAVSGKTDNSVVCTIENVGTVQNIDTKPDNRIIVDSDGKSNVVYGGSSQEISLSYYVYLRDTNDTVFQFSVSDDVYAAMSRKIGDTITICSKEDWFGNAYYWQGKKLKNPMQITESKEQNVTATDSDTD